MALRFLEAIPAASEGCPDDAATGPRSDAGPAARGAARGSLAGSAYPCLAELAAGRWSVADADVACRSLGKHTDAVVVVVVAADPFRQPSCVQSTCYAVDEAAFVMDQSTEFCRLTTQRATLENDAYAPKNKHLPLPVASKHDVTW